MTTENIGFYNGGNPPASANSSGWQYILWQKATTISAGTLTSIHFYTKYAVSGQKFGVAIYSDNSSAPGNLLNSIAASSGTEITSSTGAYFSADVSSWSQAVTASTVYWLAVAVTGTSSDSIYFWYGSSGGLPNEYYKGNSGIFPATGAGAVSSNLNIGVYGVVDVPAGNLSGIMF